MTLSLKNILKKVYVKEEKGEELSLLLEVKTRWNTLLTMLQRFIDSKTCIQESLIDLNHHFKRFRIDLLVVIVTVLSSIKLTVEALCRQDANLCTADAALKFLLNRLDDNKYNFTDKMKRSLFLRCGQRRRVELSGVLNYLQNP